MRTLKNAPRYDMDLMFYWLMGFRRFSLLVAWSIFNLL